MPTFTYQLQGQTATIVAHDVVADSLRADPTYTELLSPEEVEELKAKEVAAELEKRKLSRKGKADEKRVRLLEEEEAARNRLADEAAARSEGGVPAEESPALNPPQTVPRGPSSDAPVDRDADHAAQQTEEN